MNDTLYFSTLEISPDLPSGRCHHGSALYASDSAGDGTVLVKQINVNPVDSEEPTAEHLEPMRFTAVGRQLLFTAGTHYDPGSGTYENVELWRSDGWRLAQLLGVVIIGHVRAVPGSPRKQRCRS